MKNNLLFNFSQFKELYNTAKNASSYNKRRNSEEKNNKILQKTNFFTYSDGKTDYSITMSKNPGLGDDHFEFFNDFKVGTDNYNLVRLKEYTNFDKILNKLSILSKAGNKLASILYENIRSDFLKLNDIITQNITSLNNLIVYQDILKLFDSSLSIQNLTSIPSKVVEFSDDLSNGLAHILNNVFNGDLKNYIEEFKDNISSYIRGSHDSVFKIEDNLKNLKVSLDSKKSVMTEIAAYYFNLDGIPDSYSDTIIKAQDILMNYYKRENNSIIQKTENILENFENNLIKSIKSETQKIDDLLINLENNITEIENETNENSQKLISNLKNSQNYIFEIIKKIKEKIRKSLGLKDNNYFISNEDINLYENSFKNLINNSLDISKKLDNDEYIDIIFDKIMINFKDNFTKANKDIDVMKELIFTLNENPLKGNYFTSNEQTTLYSDIRGLYTEIFLKLKKENDFYLNETQTKLNEFLKGNKEKLKSLINKLYTDFSEEKIKKISELYNKGFNSSIKILKNKLKQNNELAINYYNDLKDVILNNTKITQILYDYKQGNLPYKREEWSSTHYVYLKFHEESIYSKKLTKGYLTKYDKFEKNLGNSLDYIQNSVFADFANEYKNVITKLKQLLQKIKNTKISDLYPDFSDLKFTDDNIEKIDELYKRLNKYISDSIFNQKYISEINTFKREEYKKVQDTKDYVENLNNEINYDEIINDMENDFCYAFTTKAYYTCTNGQLSYDVPSDDYYCLHLANYSENYKNVEEISIYNIEDINEFIKEFKDFYSIIEEKVNSYDSIMQNLKLTLSSVKDITIEQEITKDLLKPFKNYINGVLKEKYEDNIIISSYEYYKNETKTKVENLLGNIGENWDKIFDSINKEIEDNINNIKSGTFEFGIMEQITSTIINNNITNNIFKSIINHQKNEFEYTISYYYNYLLRIIKSAYKYILNGVPTNKNGFNEIINLRKKEITEFFENLLNKINNLKKESCFPQKQLEVLQINEENFFDLNDILNDTINKNNESLTIKAMKPFNYFFDNDEYSFINRFYLENSLVGKEIKELFKEIEDNTFIKLKVDTFINLIKENFLFDKKEYLNKIEEIINNLELNIEKTLLKKNKEYKSSLEEKITEIFTKDRMIEEVNNLYKKGITELEDKKIQEINNNINDILSKIKEHISNEANRLQTSLVSYTNDYSVINNTLNGYKKEIFDKLNISFKRVIEEFYLEIRQKLLKEYVEKMMDHFLSRTFEYTSSFVEKTTLNNKYNSTKIIVDIVNELCVEYKNITENQIENKYKEYYNEIKNKLDLDGLKIKINNEIQNEYNLKLLNALEKVAIFNEGDTEYTEYDFNDSIKEEIKEIIDSKIKEIDNAILTTKGYKDFEITLKNWYYNFDDSKVFEDIDDSLNHIISSEKEDEIQLFKNKINDFFVSNFNELLSEIILSFGKDFFNRIIKYNDNFKITCLYNNIKLSLFQTISYYIMINIIEDINELPRDLKSKLYTLNNIDFVAKENNKKVLDILNEKIDCFVNESMKETIDFFISKIQQYIIKDKDNNFNYEINNALKEIINDLKDKDQFTDFYISLLNDNFKNIFIDSYKNSMNKQLNELLENINEQKEVLKSEIDNCFTLEPEEVLNEINNKINNTLESLNEYNSKYYDGFSISNDFTNYLNNYGNNVIQPLYIKLIELIDDSTKNIILNNINKNSKIFIENLNTNAFNELSNKTYSLTKEIYEKIKNSINIYGIKEYNNNLNNEIININLRNIRRLNGEMTDEDQEKEKNINIDRGVSEIFKKLLEYSENLIIFVNGFEEFNKFKNNIINALNSLDDSFSKSKNQIIKNNYENYITDNLTEKLIYLKNISSDYYNSLNETFCNLEYYLNRSIYEIYDLLNQCENITYKTFSEKYENITKEIKFINKEYNNDTEISPIKHNSSWENNNLMATAKFKNLKKKGKFNFFYKYEKGSSPIMRVELVDECKPEDLELVIEEQYADCGKNVEEVIAKFDDVNITFITYIDYNIILNQINMTTIANFDSYEYDIYKYKIQTSSRKVCKIILGNEICVGGDGCSEVGIRNHNTITKGKFSDTNSIIFTP